MEGRPVEYLLCAPGGLRSYASFVEVTGIDWNEIERGKWKRYFKITPKQVADFIRRTWL